MTGHRLCSVRRNFTCSAAKHEQLLTHQQVLRVCQPHSDKSVGQVAGAILQGCLQRYQHCRVLHLPAEMGCRAAQCQPASSTGVALRNSSVCARLVWPTAQA